MTFRSTLITAACLCATPILLEAQTIYQTGFDGPVGPEWSADTRSITPSGRRFLGEFSNRAVALSLTNLTTHTNVTVTFDLFIIDSWDGSNTNNPGGAVVGPDLWDLRVAGGPVLLHTTFSNNEDEPFKRQAYPDNYPDGWHLPRSGAAEVRTLGYAARGDSVYRLRFAFPHTAGTLELRFSASGLEERLNESWGLDNVAVALAGVPAEAPPQIVVQPRSVTTLLGSSVRMEVVTLPWQSAEFQWFHDDTPIADARSSILDLAGVQADDAGSYFVRLRNAQGAMDSQTATITVVEGPESQVANEGQTVQLVVRTTGPAPLQFQWGINGLDLPGATNPVLALPSLTLDRTANYFIRVVAPDRTLPLPPAKVTVLPFGFEAVYSADLETPPGSEWSARPRGVTGIGRRWFLGPFSSQTTTLTVSNAPPRTDLLAFLDLFIVGSWDGNGPSGGPDVWSAELQGETGKFTTTFNNSTSLPSHPSDQPQAFPGQHPGAAWPGRTGQSEGNTLGFARYGLPSWDAVYGLALTFPAAGEPPRLRFAASGLESIENESWGLDNVVVATANLPPAASPIFTALPRHQVVREGGVAFFVAGAVPTASTTWQWKFNGQPLPGQTTSVLLITNVAATHAGDYSVEARNPSGTATRAPAHLAVVTQEPQGQTVNRGATAVFKVQVAGEGVRYQWRQGGLDLLGATNAVLTLNGVTRDNAGEYSVIVHNGGTPWVSAPASLATPSSAFPGGLLWTFQASSPISSTPAIAPDRTLHFSSEDGWFYALRADGQEKWKRRLGDYALSSPVLGNDGTIYVTHNNLLHALTDSGKTNWVVTLPAGVAFGSPAITADGNRLYASTINGGTTKLVCLDRLGREQWAFEAGGRVYCSPAIGADGTVYFGTLDTGVLYALAPDGTKKWQHSSGAEWLYSSPAIGADGAIYFGRAAGAGQLVALGPDGRLIRTWRLDAQVTASPAIGVDGSVYIASTGGKMYVLRPSGAAQWEVSLGSGSWFASTPAVTAKGTVCVWTESGRLIALNTNGVKQWEVITGGTSGSHLRSSPILAPDGTVYIGAADGKLYAIRGDAGPADSAWPMFRHDARHTGRAPLRVEPQNLSVSLGANVTFRTVTGEIAPTAYEWLFNGTNVLQGTNAALTLPGVGLQQAGNYAVVVKQAAATSTYSGFSLSVDPAFTKVTTSPVVTDGGDSLNGAWGDFDNDGWLDLYVANGSNQANFLYRNIGNGTFAKVTVGSIASDLATSVAAYWGDADNNGFLDLFVANWGGENNFLYQGRPGGELLRVATGNIVSDDGSSNGGAWADYDGDGNLDLFVPNALGQANFLYRGTGDGTFTRVASGGIVSDRLPDAVAGVWGDFDGDGRPDLFVANDYPGDCALYRNEGAGRFTKITAGIVVNDGRHLGAAWGDYDNDGDLDLAATAFTVLDLYRNEGSGRFSKTTIASDARILTGCAWGDYDNDGWLDLFASDREGVRNLQLRNNRDGTFMRASSGSPVNDGGKSWGAAWGDYDNDGFLDLFVGNRDGGTNFLYRGTPNGNRWLKVKLVGTVSNRLGIGAKVRVKATLSGQSLWQMREVSSGGTFGHNAIDPHFGLGDATTVEALRIEWPSGITQELRGLAVDRLVTVHEPPLLAVGLKQPDASFEIILTSRGGFRYAIEGTSEVGQAWMRLGTLSNVNGSVQFLDTSAKSAPQRFYRAVMLP